jgi:hypothetical protein
MDKKISAALALLVLTGTAFAGFADGIIRQEIGEGAMMLSALLMIAPVFAYLVIKNKRLNSAGFLYMPNGKQIGRRGRIALVIILLSLSLLLIYCIEGLFTTPSGGHVLSQVEAYSTSDSIKNGSSIEEALSEPLTLDDTSYNDSDPGCVSSSNPAGGNGSVPANGTQVIKAGKLVSCYYTSNYSTETGKKRILGVSTTTTTFPQEKATTTSSTTTLNDPSTTTTTLADSTTTTSIPSATTTLAAIGATTSVPSPTTTTSAPEGTRITTTLNEGTTTTTSGDATTTTVASVMESTSTTSSTSTTTIPEASEFSSAWFALVILIFVPAFSYVVARRG